MISFLLETRALQIIQISFTSNGEKAFTSEMCIRTSEIRQLQIHIYCTLNKYINVF